MIKEGEWIKPMPWRDQAAPFGLDHPGEAFFIRLLDRVRQDLGMGVGGSSLWMLGLGISNNP